MPASPLHPRPARLIVPATVEQVLWVAITFWIAVANRPFLHAALSGREPFDLATWGFVLALAIMLGAVHFLLLAPLANRWTLKPLLVLLTLATALATYYMQRLGVYLDPSMIRNVLHTDAHEALELLSWALLPHLLLYAGLPLVLLARVRVIRRPWHRAVAVRLAAMLLAAVAGVAALLAVFQPFASLMRNHKEVRYLATPANYLWSVAAVAAAETRGAAAARQPIGEDAMPGPSWPQQTRPVVLVVVVGETARAADWGLNGYVRQTTPQLARLPVINFGDVVSCGTNTEVSLPCMFAPVGRRDYDEARIRGSESLLHVAARAGVAVRWRDNQSGCKGVCDGLPTDTVQSLGITSLCSDGHCLDEGLLHGLDEQLVGARGTQLIVLHQLGNHGPAYFRRYPPAFARFQPACASDDLRICTRAEIVNAYDNALLYTDDVLARLIAKLQSRADTLDAAVVYVSDHGESLGENGMYLHGMPRAIAPDVQTRVPMLMWMSEGFAKTRGIDTRCLHERATRPASHDHLFHTLLGLLDVRTTLYEPAFDLTAGCRADVARWLAH
jgi:lipid A ethanolaminephosphotransferase